MDIAQVFQLMVVSGFCGVVVWNLDRIICELRLVFQGEIDEYLEEKSQLEGKQNGIFYDNQGKLLKGFALEAELTKELKNDHCAMFESLKSQKESPWRSVHPQVVTSECMADSNCEVEINESRIHTALRGKDITRRALGKQLNMKGKVFQRLIGKREVIYVNQIGCKQFN